jgi:light-regulated signal transduction histidine kinase (bacteriophytochrome)
MVSTYGEMLRRKYGNQLDARAEEYIGYIVEGGSRMERLLRDLRAFTHASLATHGPPPIVDSQTALDSALTNLTAAIGENGAEITSDPLPCVAIHQFQLEQLFQNIIGNAIRYRSEASPRIHVDAERNCRRWRFSIRDNGIGIDPEYKEQVFGIFKRLHTSSEYPGTGMGLAICQRIVERAGGRIWVDSEPGRGSTFFFELPEAPGN